MMGHGSWTWSKSVYEKLPHTRPRIMQTKQCFQVANEEILVAQGVVHLSIHSHSIENPKHWDSQRTVKYRCVQRHNHPTLRTWLVYFNTEYWYISDSFEHLKTALYGSYALVSLCPMYCRMRTNIRNSLQFLLGKGWMRNLSFGLCSFSLIVR